MARPKAEIPLQYHNIGLGVGDYAAMGALFPALGAPKAIRTLVHNYIKSVRAATSPIEIVAAPEELGELIND